MEAILRNRHIQWFVDQMFRLKTFVRFLYGGMEHHKFDKYMLQLKQWQVVKNFG